MNKLGKWFFIANIISAILCVCMLDSESLIPLYVLAFNMIVFIVTWVLYKAEEYTESEDIYTL